MRVVDLDGAGADQHRVAQGPQSVRVEAGGRAGDPATGAVGGGAASVEGGGELPGDEGPAVLDGEGPHPVEGAGLVGAEPGLDLDAGGAQSVRATDRDRVEVALGDHHPPYAGCHQRPGAGAGAAGVVAGLEGDNSGGAWGRPADLGQRVDLGVRRTCAAMVSLGDRAAVGVEQDTADPRVRPERYAVAGRQCEGAAHRGPLTLAEAHLRPSGPGRGLRGNRATVWSRLRSTDVMGARPTTRHPACASHPDFDRRSRSSTWSTGDWLSSGRGLLRELPSVTAGADFHRPQSTRALGSYVGESNARRRPPHAGTAPWRRGRPRRRPPSRPRTRRRPPRRSARSSRG